MTSEIIKPTIVDGIEFYVAADKRCGMSQSGLARLAGVGEGALRAYIAGSLKTTPETLETSIYQDSALDENIYLDVEAANGAKILDAEFCAKVIEHYAFEAKSSFDNSTALFSFRKFAKMGIERWIHQVTGQALSEESKMLQLTMGEILQEIRELRAENREWKSVQTQVVSHQMSGLSAMLKELADGELKALPVVGGDSDGYFTVSEYLQTKKCSLEKSALHRFANIAAQTYRSMLQTDPAVVMRESTQGSKTSRVNGYKQEHFAILQVALTKVISS